MSFITSMCRDYKFDAYCFVIIPIQLSHTGTKKLKSAAFTNCILSLFTQNTEKCEDINWLINVLTFSPTNELLMFFFRSFSTSRLNLNSAYQMKDGLQPRSEFHPILFPFHFIFFSDLSIL